MFSQCLWSTFIEYKLLTSLTTNFSRFSTVFSFRVPCNYIISNESNHLKTFKVATMSSSSPVSYIITGVCPHNMVPVSRQRSAACVKVL